MPQPATGRHPQIRRAQRTNAPNEAYALYLTILLVIIGNLPGAILSFFLFRSLRFGNLEGELAPKYRWALLPAMVFYVLVTVVLLAANLAMWSK